MTLLSKIWQISLSNSKIFAGEKRILKFKLTHARPSLLFHTCVKYYKTFSHVLQNIEYKHLTAVVKDQLRILL